ncbi:unnamed protein product [Sphagnum troendelagicum]|uniref:Uncharacterized protein n=1 Tax=Sphagnum troendelagicum TaxID=128251 RepID=A0ABP0TVN6_9BRYO
MDERYLEELASVWIRHPNNAVKLKALYPRDISVFGSKRRGRSTALHAAVMAMEEAREDSVERGWFCSGADALHLLAETQQLAWKRNVRISF